MIRRIVVSLVPLLVAAPLMAQTMVGVRAGLSRATVSPAVEGEGLQDARQGVVAGLDIAFPLASTVELRIGGAYSQKGTSYSAELASEGFDDIGGRWDEIDRFRHRGGRRCGNGGFRRSVAGCRCDILPGTHERR